VPLLALEVLGHGDEAGSQERRVFATEAAAGRWHFAVPMAMTLGIV